MSTGTAPWWDNPETGRGDGTVIRHAPDANHYHIPDQNQLSHMGGSPVGKFAVVPEAMPALDGRSRGFDANVAGPVHVDPGAPDGGVIFDPALVRREDINAAVETSYFPHQAYYKLGAMAPKLAFDQSLTAPEFQSRSNPHLSPGAYIAPRSGVDGRQVAIPVSPNASYEMSMAPPVPPLNSLPPLPMPTLPHPVPPPAMSPHMQHETQAPQAPQAPPYAPYPPPYPYAYPPPGYPPAPVVPPMSQQMIETMQQLMQGMAVMQSRLSQVEQGRQVVQALPPTTGVSPNPMPIARAVSTQPVDLRTAPAQRASEEYVETARPIRKRRQQDGEDEPPRRSILEHDTVERQRVSDLEKDSDDSVIMGFETLGITWVTGPLPNKAKKQVFFNFPNGKMSARYHDVLLGNGTVVLVYDTRYEDGQQFLPPNCGEKPVLLEVPAMKLKRYVMCFELSASLGCFDLVILVDAKDPETGEEINEES